MQLVCYIFLIIITKIIIWCKVTQSDVQTCLQNTVL